MVHAWGACSAPWYRPPEGLDPRLGKEQPEPPEAAAGTTPSGEAPRQSGAGTAEETLPPPGSDSLTSREAGLDTLGWAEDAVADSAEFVKGWVPPVPPDSAQDRSGARRVPGAPSSSAEIDGSPGGPPAVDAGRPELSDLPEPRSSGVPDTAAASPAGGAADSARAPLPYDEDLLFEPGGSAQAPAVPWKPVKLPPREIGPQLEPPSPFNRSPGLWNYAPGLQPSSSALLHRLISRAATAHRAREEASIYAPERAAGDSVAIRAAYSRVRLKEVADSLGKVIPPLRRITMRGQTRVADQVSVRLDQATIQTARTLDGTDVQPPVVFQQPDYLRSLTASSFQRLWAAEMAKGLRATAIEGSRRGLIKLDIPVELPSQLRGVFGEGKPNLSVKGSERISFGGQSTWRPYEKSNELNIKRSKFPQLDMKQELNLQLTGTIGDKVSVDVDQSSQQATPLANRIKIRYKGYDDEIIQRVDLGNTSLSLPGTEYVSFGGRAEGLFGIQAQSKVGDIDLTTILTKQEGKSDTKTTPGGQAETRTVEINDYEYVAGKYFFLADPDDCPWELDQSTLRVYLDDSNGSNDIEKGARPATATTTGSDTGQPIYQGNFHLLTAGAASEGDYVINDYLYAGLPVIVLNRPLGEDDCLAVAYGGWLLDARLQRSSRRPDVGFAPIDADTLRLKMIRPTLETVSAANWNRSPWKEVQDLELRNIYDLRGNNIEREGFQLRIRRRFSSQGVQDPDRLADTTFLQITALDLTKYTGSYEPGRDDRVDSEFIDYESGLLHFPDLRPFDPTPSDLGEEPANCNGFGYIRFNPDGDAQRAPRPAPLPEGTEFRAAAIYDSLVTRNRQTDGRYYLEVTYRSAVSHIVLNAYNIIQGSEVVTAGGRTLVRDRDYRIDYDMGEVEILDGANVLPNEEVRVTYSHVPFGGGSQKTLAGMAATFRPEETPYSLSTSWIFESTGGVPGAEGRRPRLGQEPSRTLVGELAGTYKADSRMLTTLLDALPGLSARTPSKLDLSFGAGLSLPNPNTKDKLYIDDFDGAKDVLSLTMNRRLWRPTSIPVSDSLLSGSKENPVRRAAARGELWWYSPRTAVQERLLLPTLDDTEGDNYRQVLRMRMFPRSRTVEGMAPTPRDSSWAGVLQLLSTRGMDLSQAQFLDIWVNDFQRYDRWRNDPSLRRGKLVLDLGRVSEDAMWFREDPDAPLPDSLWYALARPNGRLDQEDRNGDDRLDQGSDLEEDTGLDGVLDGVPVGPGQRRDDPFDNYDYDESLPEEDRRKYASVNGMEDNQELDSEDLNGDDGLDVVNSYFQIAIDLGDSTLWETDVWRDYPASEYRDPGNHRRYLGDNNGWRRIRIPLGDLTRVRPTVSGTATPPRWESIQHLRVWLTGFDRETELELGGIEITGNKWYEGDITDVRDRPLPSDSLGVGEDFYVGVVNNKDDAAIYTPPIDVHKDNDVREREQAISLNMVEFEPAHRASIYRTYGQKQDYTLYERMQFYVNRYPPDSTNLTLAIRLCREDRTDTTNYYEYRRPVPRNWELFDVDLAELTRLQLETPDSSGLVTRDLGGGIVISRRGAPSRNNIKRISFLLTNEGPGRVSQASVWVNELHLSSVQKDVGVAARLRMSAILSDIGELSLDWRRTGADFLKLGQERGQGYTATQWNLRGSTNLRRFAGFLGLEAPVSASMTVNRQTPKFSTNSDLVLEKATDRDISESRSSSYSLSLSRRSTEGGWARYVIDPFSVSGSLNRNVARQPLSRDTVTTRSGSVGWNFSFQDWGEIGLSQNLKARLLPTSLSASVAGSRSTETHHRRIDLSQPFVKEPAIQRTSATMSLSGAMQPLTPISYRIDSGRDLMLRKQQQQLFGFNLGRETSRRHQLSASFALPVLRRLLGPRYSWSGNSNLAWSQVTLRDEPPWQSSFGNSQNHTFQGTVNPSDLVEFVQGIGRSGASDDSAGAPPKPVGQRSGVQVVRPINISYSIARQTSFTGRVGTPSLLYQLGLSEQPGSNVSGISDARSRDNHGDTRTLSMDTSVKLPRQANLTTRYSRTSTKQRSSGLLSTTESTKWPDFDVNWGQIYQAVGISRWFQSFSASTRYSRDLREQKSASSTNTTTTTTFSPLLNITATLKSGLSATLNSSTSSNHSETPETRTVNDSDRKSVGLNVKKTLNLKRTIKVPMSDRRQTVTTRVDVNASVDWRSEKSSSRTGIQATPTVTRNMASLKFATGLGYQFTQTITGNGQINFGQNTDRKNRAQTERFIGITLSASFTF